ncbi:sucrase ferredoxin [Scytonema tolypothrichoides VB-61278]|nr:sucrase ferredoxin [Scytonema tolypothrichoides VB-61278]
MNTFFCSDHSRQIGEDIIGSGTNNQTYILIECRTPWAAEALNSRWIPENLRLLIQKCKSSKVPIKFLLIANNLSHKVDGTTLLIYQKKEGLSNGYHKQEFHLAHIEQAAGIVRKWLSGQSSSYEVKNSATRDILVCTHGSHDLCCARYGNPFYAQAVAMSEDLCLDNVRIWKSSHFGGHRFAPTIIDLPEGRYYGALEQDSFRSILTRTGDINCLNKVYRGWGILPTSIQVLERELILRHGWDWFDYRVGGRIIEESSDKTTILAELTVEKPDSSLDTYQAKLVKNDSKTIEMKGSCNAKQESLFVKYSVASLSHFSETAVACTA